MSHSPVDAPPDPAAPAAAPNDDPHCGKCGYCIRGVPSFTCPECGSDLRVVGIVTPTTHPRLTRIQRAAVWTVTIVLCMALFSHALVQLLPTPHVTTVRRVIFSQFAPLQVTIEAESHFTWFGWGTSYSRGTPPLEVVTLRANGPAGPALQVNWKTKAYYFAGNGQDVEQPGGFGPDALLAWLNAAGVKAEDPTALLKTWNGPPIEQATAERLQQIVADVDTMAASQNAFTAHPLKPGSIQVMIAHPSTVFTTPSPWTNVALVVFWVLAWLIGLWWLLRRPRPDRQPAPAAAP